MATSGSFQTNSYDSYPYPNKYTLVWSRSSTGANSSHINWQIYGDGGAGGGYYQVNHGTRVYLNGGLIADREDDLNLTQGYVLFSSSFDIGHDANGNCSFSMSAGGDLNTFAQSISGGGSWALDRIPLAPTITSLIADSITPVAARLGAEISSYGHGTGATFHMYYRENGVGSYIDAGAQADAAGYNYWNLTGLKPGKTYQYYCTCTNNNGDTATSSVHTFATQAVSGIIAVMRGIA